MAEEIVEVTLYFNPLKTPPSKKPFDWKQEADKILQEIDKTLNLKVASQVPVANNQVPATGNTANTPIRKSVTVYFESNPLLVEKREGCLAVDLCVKSQDVWTHIGNLQDEIYDPRSNLNVKSEGFKLVPFRAYVKESRVSYNASSTELTKEELHTKLAAIAAKKVFFELAKQEFDTREALAEALVSAEQSKEKLDQMTTMFDEIAATCTDPVQVKKGFDLLKDTHAAVQKNAEIVSTAAEEVGWLHILKEEAKLGAYFCSARAGLTTESYQEWARKEFVFTYLPRETIPDSSRKEVCLKNICSTLFDFLELSRDHGSSLRKEILPSRHKFKQNRYNGISAWRTGLINLRISTSSVFRNKSVRPTRRSRSTKLCLSTPRKTPSSSPPHRSTPVPSARASLEPSNRCLPRLPI